jgi:hypothetical protein
MPSQEYAPQPQQSRETHSETAPVKGLSAERQSEVDRTKRDTDDLMDEIDELLESAEAISAKEYTQVGGE